MKRALASLALLALPLAAVAQQPVIVQNNDSAQTFIHDDLYKAGGDIRVDTAVTGDALLFGGKIRVDAPVGSELQAIGGDVDVNALVRSGGRIAGGNIVINAPVNGDLVIAGGDIRLTSAAVIAGDLAVLGGKVTIDGIVRGALQLYTKEAFINGTVSGMSDIQAERVMLRGKLLGDSAISAKTITMAEGAIVGGNLRYWHKAGTTNFGPAVRGKAVFDQTLKPSIKQPNVAKRMAPSLIAAFLFYSLFSTAVTLGVFLFLTKNLFKEAAKSLDANPLINTLKGLGFFVLTPVLAVILMLTIVGLPLGIVALLVYGMVFILAKPITVLIGARWLEMYYQKKWRWWMLLLVALGLFLVLKLVGAIPFIGWLVCAVTVSAGTGTMLDYKYRKWKKYA